MNKIRITEDEIKINDQGISLDEKISRVEESKVNENQRAFLLRDVARQYASENELLANQYFFIRDEGDSYIFTSKENEELAVVSKEDLNFADYVKAARLFFSAEVATDTLLKITREIEDLQFPGLAAFFSLEKEPDSLRSQFYGIELVLTDDYKVFNMVNSTRKEELVRELVKILEAEKGVPVQLQVDTPISQRYAGTGYGREFFCQFVDRPVVVNRVKNLDSKYEGDVSLLEGKYTNLRNLQETVTSYNALHSFPTPGNLATKAYKLVATAAGLAENKLISNSLATNFVEGSQLGWPARLSKDFVYEVLDKNEIKYLKHNIVARPDGVYDDRTLGGSLSVVDETKIADVSIEPLK